MKSAEFTAHNSAWYQISPDKKIPPTRGATAVEGFPSIKEV